MRICSRYAVAVAVLLGAALVPTVIHSYIGVTVDDGPPAAVIGETLNGVFGSPTARPATWGQRRFGSDDWIERVYGDRTAAVRLVVVRSFDAKRLYHHPELAAAYGASVRPVGVQRLPALPHVPVHVLASDGSPRHLVLYALYSEGRFIEDPVAFQLQSALRLMASGRRPMTLFFVHQPGVDPDVRPERAPAAGVLAAAIREYEAAAARAASPSGR